MLKFMFAGRRAPGRSRAGALRHLRDVHGPMVVLPPADAGAMPRDYVQNHVIDGAYPGEGVHAIERDLVTELWFETIDEMRSAVETPYYLARLRPDEPRFVDNRTVAKMLVEPTVLIEGHSGCFKLFVFISWTSSTEAGSAIGQGRSIDRMSTVPGLTRLVENIVQPGPDGSAPFVDVVLEGWFATEEAALGALEHLEVLLPVNGEATVDRSRCFAVAAREFDRARLIQLHGGIAANEGTST